MDAKKVSPKIIAILSFFIWGLGQLLNKQYIKALFFFIIQCLLVFGELLTGNYFSGSFVIREDAGFFVHGIWGLITLGEVPRQMTLSGLSDGDHSIILLINGIIVGLVLLLFLVICIWNVKDAYKTRKQYNETGYLPTSKLYLKELWETMFHYIILLPAIILLIFLALMPIIFSLLTAFTNYSRNNMPPAQLVSWVGLTNFKNLVTMPVWSNTFIGVFRWTIIWAVIATTTTFFGGLFQAVLLNNKRVKFRKVWRGILILPWAIPSMISLLVFRTMFNGQFGPISQFLIDIGFTDERISWLADPNNPNLAKGVIIFVNFWLGFPFFMALMTGVLTGIPEEIYEAAKIDGATSFQEFRKITFPLVITATTPLLIMSFASNFNNFNVIYFLTEGGPINPAYQFAGHTDILITWIYSLTMDNQMFHMSSVMSILIFIIIGSLSTWNFTRTKAFKED